LKGGATTYSRKEEKERKKKQRDRVRKHTDNNCKTINYRGEGA
jgi:hypothetical protein